MRPANHSGSKKRSSWWMLGLCVFSVCGPSGCADKWDEVTSRDFKIQSLWARKPDPMDVLNTSTDGAKLGLALAALKEPKQHGGTDEQQDAYIRLLKMVATGTEKDVQRWGTDQENHRWAIMIREPLCRLGAIRALSEFKDPRAAEILEIAFLQQYFKDPKLNTDIRMQALIALEKTGSSIARNRFLLVAGSPGPIPS